MSDTKLYYIRSHYFQKDDGWKTKVEEYFGSYSDAGSKASGIAKVLDGIHGDDHFWTVDLIDPETNGSYFQLFHRRTE